MVKLEVSNVGSEKELSIMQEIFILNPTFGSAESTYTSAGSFPAANAFNDVSGVNLDFYASAENVGLGWLAYDFQTEVAISKYSIERMNDFGNSWSPTAWIFEGSVDGSTWIQLDQQSGISWEAGAPIYEVQEFEITVSNPQNLRPVLRIPKIVRFLGGGTLL